MADGNKSGAESDKIEQTAQPAGPNEPNITRVNWDDSQMQTSFANVINVINTREEFTVLFGTNQTWNLPSSRELTVRLSNRVVLTPFAAKRLMVILAARVQDYEKRFGNLSLEG
jgi:hypothetical protein